MKNRLKTTLLLFSLLGANVAATAKGSEKVLDLSATEKNELEIVLKYLAIVFTEINKGKGLNDLLDENFNFHDPMTDAKNAADFINGVQAWISVPKTYQMTNQVVKDNQVCSFYTITIKMPDGRTGAFELADYVYFENGKISKENVFFFDPAGFAKFMGIKDYLKKYDLK